MKQSNSRKSRETTAFLYPRLSRDDNLDGESYSIQNQVIIYKGWFLPPNIYYDCGSFVVNRKAVVGKEKKPFNRYKPNTKGAAAYDNCYIIKRSLRFRFSESAGFYYF